VLVGAVATRLEEIIREACDPLGADVLEVEAMPDHVHLAATAEAIRELLAVVGA